jgi:hypothetical protein
MPFTMPRNAHATVHENEPAATASQVPPTAWAHEIATSVRRRPQRSAP